MNDPRQDAKSPSSGYLGSRSQEERNGSVMQQKARYAGLWPRFLALCVDFLLFCAAFFPITRIVKGAWLMTSSDHRWSSGLFITDPLCLLFLGVMVLYFVLLEGSVGATLGKWLVGLRVVRESGGRPGLKRSLSRNLFRVVDGLPAFNIVGIVLILRSSECARFGDRIAGTRVVHRRSRRGRRAPAGGTDREDREMEGGRTHAGETLGLNRH
jgi:uncharacterized RDD family membrane protein YckC